MMDCEFFGILVNDLAQERLGETGLARRLLCHAGECSECGRRLDEMRALTGSLRAMAARDAQEQAPDRVEAALLEHFRGRRRGALAGLWKGKWVATAAGVCLIAAGLAVWSRNPPQRVRGSRPAVTAPAMPPTSRSVGTMEATARKGASVAAPKGKLAALARDSYAGFIPLPYDEGAAPLGGSRQIVRVEVARSALASMGFPVADAASSSYVQADVLIGEDGVARAIRFEPQEGDSSR
ncbi:MAG: hypothetical protein ACRD10_09500 [Terriglobia bacterium]